MQQSDPFIAIAILLAAALLGGLLAHRLKQPVILGYLIIGVAIGPHALGLVSDLEIVEAAATIGVSLLIFTIGMEVSINQLREVGKIGIWGGILQIILTIGIGVLVGLTLFQWSTSQAIIFGLVISLSSTAVCLKILMDRGELSSVQGRIMVAMLILQDISVVFMSLVMPLIGGDTNNLPIAVIASVGKVVIFIIVAIVLGRWVLPWLLGGVGGFRSRELFLLTILVLCLGAAVSTQVFGLSIIFGAFLVGLVLRETRFVQQAIAEITPLRDIFASLFFVSLGMLLDPTFLIDNWAIVVLTVVAIIVIKTIVISGIVISFGYSKRVALFSAAGLFQIGEFGFIITQGGLETSIISESFYSLILASAVITMILTPLLVSLVGQLHHRFVLGIHKKRLNVNVPESKMMKTPSSHTPKHVVIVGYGEVGQSIANGLHEANIPYFIIDDDPERVSEAKVSGHPRIYGDATNINVLAKADLSQACALVVAYPDPIAVMTTVKLAQLLNPDIVILARASRRGEIDQLKRLGVNELVIPEREAGYKFVKLLLNSIGLEREERKRVLNLVRNSMTK
ncbi:MAG: cation:proton antiporter [Dehalococcoidia bacterium]|nr:MAG: cation:proton antiporter [Dehalococcoidia bacterium]